MKMKFKGIVVGLVVAACTGLVSQLLAAPASLVKTGATTSGATTLVGALAFTYSSPRIGSHYVVAIRTLATGGKNGVVLYDISSGTTTTIDSDTLCEEKSGYHHDKTDCAATCSGATFSLPDVDSAHVVFVKQARKVTCELIANPYDTEVPSYRTIDSDEEIGIYDISTGSLTSMTPSSFSSYMEGPRVSGDAVCYKASTWGDVECYSISGASTQSVTETNTKPLRLRFALSRGRMIVHQAVSLGDSDPYGAESDPYDAESDPYDAEDDSTDGGIFVNDNNDNDDVFGSGTFSQVNTDSYSSVSDMELDDRYGAWIYDRSGTVIKLYNFKDESTQEITPPTGYDIVSADVTAVFRASVASTSSKTTSKTVIPVIPGVTPKVAYIASNGSDYAVRLWDDGIESGLVSNSNEKSDAGIDGNYVIWLRNGKAVVLYDTSSGSQSTILGQ